MLYVSHKWMTIRAILSTIIIIIMKFFSSIISIINNIIIANCLIIRQTDRQADSTVVNPVISPEVGGGRIHLNILKAVDL